MPKKRDTDSDPPPHEPALLSAATASLEDRASFSSFLTTLSGRISDTLRQSGLSDADTAFLLDPSPNNGLSPKEQLLAYSMAKGGHTHAELSRLTGLAYRTVTSLSADPRIRRAVAILQHAAGLPDVIARFKALTPRAVEVMSELMNDASVPATTRLEAAKCIIERIYGKATAHIEADGNLLTSLLEKLDSRTTPESASLLADLPDDPDPIN